MMFFTLRWHEGAVEFIDQRRLPHSIAIVRCESASAVAEAIRDLVVRGAPAIGCAAAYGYALAALAARHQPLPEFQQALREASAMLEASRPTAVNLAWALQRMARVAKESAATGNAPTGLAQQLLHEALAISAEDVSINRRLGEQGAALLPDPCRVLTHCNAGALATAGHGTALGIIRSAVEAGKRISVYADETRPVLQGARLTAWELMQSGIPVTLITDSAAGHLMAQGEIDAVIVGADRVAANGDVANKIGTYMVAVLARRHNIPFYVACPLSTLDSSTPTGRDIVIEERPAHEVTGDTTIRWAPEGVTVRNPAFDITPFDLVTALITEHGIWQPAP
ncbi:MAG: S-methyl-5-thioribose-1-phosphate isomerase [Betaproteobacteria bacterium]|nr:S-methyl-5-thioribose-1-phosphate isomerase [Betaproteobacteria bacterium]